jgi:outer membrane cobalamin receptor
VNFFADLLHIMPLMISRIHRIFALSFLLLFGCLLKGQNDTSAVSTGTLDFYEMSLEQLLKLKSHGVPSELEKLINTLIGVASKKPMNTRESPSIVSLVTEEEIKKSGARDLIDVLRLIPGMDFGLDVEGVVGVAMRGNWAHEGKVLVLLDGQEMNEMLFACNFFGNHYSVDQIKKVEVIRGPGSAIYGGYAEYGVINIVTKQGGDLKGIQASATYGQMATDYGRRNLSLQIGDKKNDLAYSISGFIGQGQRSDRDYTDYNDSSYNMAGKSSLNPNYFNAALSYKGFSTRVIGDFYNTTILDGYGDIIKDGVQKETYHSIFAETKYEAKVNEKLKITPKFNYKTQTPWKTGAYRGKDAYDITAHRTTANVTASYNHNRYINVIFGGETYYDYAVNNIPRQKFSNNKTTVSYYNMAVFTQGLIKTRLVNIIAGARFDKHNVYGHAFVPRIGLTKKYDRFHFKALYSTAFRAPAIENINHADSNGMKPELTSVAELELGYQVTRKSIFTINFYDINTKDPIIYYTDSIATDFYGNFGKSGTSGVEAEYKIRDKWGYIAINYAYYTAATKEKVALYETEGGNSLLGLANQRLNFIGNWNVTPKFSINTTLSYYGSRYAITSLDSTGTGVQELTPSKILLNFFLRYEPFKGMSVGLGAYNALNTEFDFLEPYDGGHPPLPGPSREIVLKLSYDLSFKKKNKSD